MSIDTDGELAKAKAEFLDEATDAAARFSPQELALMAALFEVVSNMVGMALNGSAPNHVTTALSIGEAKWELTLQRAGGKTPVDCIRELEAEVAALRVKTRIGAIAVYEATLRAGVTDEERMALRAMTAEDVAAWLVRECFTAGHRGCSAEPVGTSEQTQL